MWTLAFGYHEDRAPTHGRWRGVGRIGQRGARRRTVDVDARFLAPRRSRPDARLCRDLRVRNGGIR
jgi:hypothetical protein